MKFSMSFILLSTLITVFTVISAKLNEVKHYGPLIKEVHDKYRSAGVIIASATSNPSFEKTTIWYEITRMLSNEGISTLIVDFRQFENRLKIDIGRTYLPLIVITVDTIGALHSFESIAKNLDMGYAVWLIFFSRDAGQDACKFCRNPHGNLLNLKFASKVLISCCDSNKIEEWWSIGKNRTKRQEVGRMINENHEIVWFSDDVLQDHRHSMDGQPLRIVAVKNFDAFNANGTDYSGLLGEIVKEMSHAINFTVSKIIWEDEFGIYSPEISSWTGVMGRIYRREADLGVSEMLMSRERSNAVRFTAPIEMGTFRLYFRKLDAAHLLWNAHLKVLTMDVWMVIIGLILTTTILLTLIEYNKKKSHFFSLLCDYFIRVWGIYCQQGLPGAYSAEIISSLAMASSYSPFTTMEEFVEDGTYGLIVVKDSLDYHTFESSNKTLIRKLMSLMKPPDSLPRNFREGFEQVCKNRVALHAHDTVKKNLANSIPCETTSIKASGVETVAMIVPRDSEYIDLINYRLQQFRHTGIFRRLERKYYTELQRNQVHHPPVPLQGIASIVFALGTGALIAFIIFIIERIFYWSTKKMRNRRRRGQNSGGYHT